MSEASAVIPAKAGIHKNESLEGWQFLPIKEFAHTTSGGTPKRGVAEYYNGDVPWVKSGDLNDGYLNKVEEYITALGLEKSSAKLFKPGTLLIALYGATIGRLSILNFEASTNQAVCGITVPEDVDVKYLFYYLLSIRQKLIDQGKGGAQPNINQQIVKETIVPLAPPEQQKRIVAKIEELFSHIDAGIEALKKAKLLLKQYRQSVLKAAVTGDLTKEWREANKDKLEPASQLLERIKKERKEIYQKQICDWEKAVKKWKDKGSKGKKPSKPRRQKEIVLGSKLGDDPNTLPEGWAKAPLAATANIDIGFAFKSKEFENEGIRLVRGENIEPGSLRWVNTKCWPEKKMDGFENLLVNEGDVILAMDRPVISTGLKIAIAKKEDLPAVLVQRVARINSVATESSKYIYYVLSTEDFINHCLGSATGTQLPHISGGQIENYEIGIPSKEEQEEIVASLEQKFESIRRLDEEIEHQLIKSERSKQSILASAFTGALN